MANDFSGDPNCVALYQFDPGVLTFDAQGQNTLTNINTVESNTTDFKEGTGSAEFALANVEYFNINDATLDPNFPFKNGSFNEDISVCLWFRLASLAVTQYIFSKYIAAAGQRTFGITAQGGDASLGVLIGYNNGDAFEFVYHPGPLQAGRWYHVGVTYSTATRLTRIRLWDDTAQTIVGNDIHTTAANAVSITDTPVTIGARGDAGRPFDGLMDEVVVFNDVLTANEISQIRQGTYSFQRQGVPASRIVDIPFTEKEINMQVRGQSRFTEILQNRLVLCAFLEALSSEVQEAYDIVLEVLRARTLARAFGVNLDILGDIVGQQRILRNAADIPYFQWDTQERGWDQGPWWSTGADLTGNLPATDSQFRNLIVAKVFRNHVRYGSIPELVVFIKLLFDLDVTIRTVGPMEIDIVVPSTATESQTLSIQEVADDQEVDRRYFLPLPATCRINQVISAPDESFTWDRSGRGWDQGAWAVRIF